MIYQNERPRRFPSEVTTLGAVNQPDPRAYESLARLMSGATRVGLFLEEVPQMPEGWIVEGSGPMLQMVLGDDEGPATSKRSANQLIELTAAESPEMMALAKLTKPGPFGRRTHELGTYLGVRDGSITRPGSLVAMAGERLRVPGYTEISAVCTHPNHSGRGYAAALMIELMRRIRERGEHPFLHVRADNARAVGLYRRLGFRERVRRYYAMVRYEGTGVPRPGLQTSQGGV